VRGCEGLKCLFSLAGRTFYKIFKIFLKFYLIKMKTTLHTLQPFTFSINDNNNNNNKTEIAAKVIVK
jgi:hypothetical protein